MTTRDTPSGDTDDDHAESSSSSHHHHQNEPITRIPTTSNGNGDLALEKTTSTASGLSIFGQRAQTVLSTIRSREPGQTARFTHPLSNTKTTEDVIVDFEGADDPYRPINWGFNKKAVTTVLYGLTTMGMLVLLYREG